MHVYYLHCVTNWMQNEFRSLYHFESSTLSQDFQQMRSLSISKRNRNRVEPVLCLHLFSIITNNSRKNVEAEKEKKRKEIQAKMQFFTCKLNSKIKRKCQPEIKCHHWFFVLQTIKIIILCFRFWADYYYYYYWLCRCWQ